MSGLTAHAVVELWERGRGKGALARANLLLEAAAPEASEDARAAWTLIERDARIIALRSASFGAAMPTHANCPACSERLEFELDSALAAGAPPPGDFTIASGARFRLPTSADMAAAAGKGSLDEAARELVRRCRLDAGGPLDESSLSEVDAAMAERQSAAAISVELTCPVCGHAWNDEIDVVAYLWAEIEQRAENLLDEVHWLASGYGWSEREILAMSAPRRQAYLERRLG